MQISDINPHIRYARVHYSHTKTAKEYGICYDCRIFFMENTSGTAKVNGKFYNITNKTALFFPPLTKYFFDFDSENVKILVLDFDLVNDFSHIKESLGTATEQNFSFYIAPSYTLAEELSVPIICPLPQILPLLRQCVENFLQKPVLYRERSSALLKMCLLEFVQQGAMKSAYSDLCEQVLSYIHQNYADTALTNSTISDNFNYHPYHLSHILKQETGKTLHQYLLYYRLRIAKNLLLTTNYSIEEISWRSGFSSNSHFIKLFRENIGITPKHYRKQQIHTEI